ncbi:hypothetical protein [Muribaculum sp.]|uniref:hypothetical protein n=1 Tax=Muribaculum sp. TaxID=1918611 RepID=UPI0025877E2E|nr:hypothetical protein [Muribaculum sp.]MCX4278981.1 hypothetical protein [Muribaculum sp.]
MYEQIEKLRHKFWLTSDKKIQLHFQDNKGLSMVKVYESGQTTSEHMYLLLPTFESEIFAFDTPNGRFTIGISSTKEEIFLSPLGIFLYPIGKTGCQPQSISINNAEYQTVNVADNQVIN